MDFEHAKVSFNVYLKGFDTSDKKIALKVGHTYRVVNYASELCERLELSAEDMNLARLIALLHDIGRFVQLKETGSFDDSIVPHAVLSNRILFEEGRIRDYIDTDEYDELIFESIKNHGLFMPDENLSGRTLLHAQIIRDADKLDNFHTKLISDIDTMLDIKMEELECETLSDYAYDTFSLREPLLNSKRETHLDMWLSYIAYIYDLNFPESLLIVKEHDYVNRLFDRVKVRDEATAKRMEECREVMNAYISE
ncbi:MAG: HD domain-containing protein [Lachnospiraceae bacterium]|nr:HD domain-containing protein [Lachnospiraceae bacterium]